MEHTDHLRNVNEGDHVTITTSEGEHFDVECQNRSVENADPRTGEVRETIVWEFSAVEYWPVVSITQGLKSSPDDPEFPIHNEAWDKQQEGNMGYISSVQIHGPKLES